MTWMTQTKSDNRCILMKVIT